MTDTRVNVRCTENLACNLSADKYIKDGEFYVVYKGDEEVGRFDDGILQAIWISQRMPVKE